jgi:hypothetical protein
LVAFFVSIDCAAFGYLLLTRIDLVVNGRLYYFGLIFSAEWADPYRTYMQLIYVCLVLPIVFSGLSLFFSFKAKEAVKPKPIAREEMKEAEPEIPQTVKPKPIAREEMKEAEPEIPQTVKPKPIAREEMKEAEPEIPQTVKPKPIAREEMKEAVIRDDNAITVTLCPNCKKAFSTPIVKIDFSSGKPRLVNACPDCDHVL